MRIEIGDVYQLYYGDQVGVYAVVIKKHSKDRAFCQYYAGTNGVSGTSYVGLPMYSTYLGEAKYLGKVKPRWKRLFGCLQLRE